MLVRYVARDLTRNKRRTVTSLVGVTLGVALFSAVLFFTDGSSASMTQRAVAPLAIDMQRVLAQPLGTDLRFTETVAPAGALGRGGTATLTLTVRNAGSVPANEVVVNDAAPPGLAYLPGSTTRDGRPVPDVAGGTPLSQGLAKTGLNIGTVGPGRTVHLEYRARASRAVTDTDALRLGATISTRENLVPTRVNRPAGLAADRLRTHLQAIPGVAAADWLAFVDLPPGSLAAGGDPIDQPVRVFAFDRRYARHYPSVRLVRGGFKAGAALLSVEVARTLRTGVGRQVELTIPGRGASLALPVSGVTDLSRARPLFYSRQGDNLEEFLYVPSSVVVDPATFRSEILPAFRAATTARGSALASRPVQEIDVLVRRSRLVAEPGTALRQSREVARAVRQVDRGPDYLIDNLSNTLAVATEDAAVAKRMFLFLGLPGGLLAAVLTAYAGGVLAAAQRREQANLRIRGADRGHLARLLAYRTVAVAGSGSVLGTALGLLSVMLVLGPATLFGASLGQLAWSAALGTGLGLLATALALYLPGRRSLRLEIQQQRGEMSQGPVPAWRRWYLDLWLLALALGGELVALRLGAFDTQKGSVYLGRAVSMPAYLMLGPVVAWATGVLLVGRTVQVLLARTPLPARGRFGPPVRGAFLRSVRRRPWTSTAGVVTLALVIAFGSALAVFTSTYDAAKADDSRYVVGSDIRVTPQVVSMRPHPPGYATRLRVAGVAAVTPVVFRPENSVLTGRYSEDRTDLAAIDPASFGRTTTLPGTSFLDSSPGAAMSALAKRPHGLFVNADTADALQVEPGDTVEVLLARATPRQELAQLEVLGLFTTLPGFPDGVDLVANLHFYERTVGTPDVDFFLVRTDGPGAAAHTAAAAALRSGPGAKDAITVAPAETALDKDRSSLTSLNVLGLLRLDSAYTMLMAGAGIGIFVFGLLLARRREYVTMSALGMRAGEIRALVVGETLLVTVAASLAGLSVGTGMAALLVHVLRPLFILDPGMTVPAGGMTVLVVSALAAALVAAIAGSEVLRRLRATELLRET